MRLIALNGDQPERSRAAARVFPGNFLFSTGPNSEGGGKRRTRDPGLEASAPSTPAEWAGMLLGRRPRQWIVPPLAADAARPVDEAALEHEAAAAARAENDAERRAEPCLTSRARPCWPLRRTTRWSLRRWGS